MGKRPRRCGQCGKELTFRYNIERDGVRMDVGQECLKRGDRINGGRGHWTTWTYQSSPNKSYGN